MWSNGPHQSGSLHKVGGNQQRPLAAEVVRQKWRFNLLGNRFSKDVQRLESPASRSNRGNSRGGA